MAELCRLLNVKRLYTSSYHPRSNARAEAFNKVILNSIRTGTEGYQEWPRLLPVIGHAHRTSVIKHLGISPFQVCFGIKPNLPVDCTSQPNLTNLPTSVKAYFEAMEPQLKLMRETVRENQLRANIQTATEYNKRRITKPIQFRLQDQVWLR